VSLDYRTRIQIAIGCIIFFALLSSVRLLVEADPLHPTPIGHDDITLNEKRFDVLRSMLPSRGEVGYTGGNLNHAAYWESDATALKDWFVAQYTLAPLVVAITPGHKIHIVNNSLDNTASKDAGLKTQNLGSGNKLLDFGNGIKLVTSEQ
jgi:hypothetical protein